MFARFRPRLTYANVVSTLCLFILLGGGAYAATSFVGSDGQIHACVNKGKLTLIKPGKTCKKGATAIAWNQKGPKGDTGPSTGPAGGDLSGNYPAPTIAGKLKDAAAGTPSLRSLGAGPLQAMPGNATPSPGGPAGGVLSGTYPTPGLAEGSVTATKFAADAAVCSVTNVQGYCTGETTFPHQDHPSAGVYCFTLPGFGLLSGAVTIDSAAAGYPVAFMSSKFASVSGRGCDTGDNVVVTTYNHDSDTSGSALTDETFYAIFY